MVYSIRVGGYAPRDSVHSRAVDHFALQMRARLGNAVAIDVLYNVMDLARPATDLLDMVQAGELTWCYFSTSYLGDQVPELQKLEQPFAFPNLDQAHAALDGSLGVELTRATRARTGLAVLGYWDNGFRHLSNRLRAVRSPDDLAGMRVRLQPNRTHAAMVEAWGGIPVAVELSEGIDLILSGAVDAQENPLANMVSYGVDRVHHHVTMTGHLYGARGIYANQAAVDALPAEVADALLASVKEAIAFQRSAAAQHEADLRRRLEADGVGFVDLTESERAAFADAVAEHGSGVPA